MKCATPTYTPEHDFYLGAVKEMQEQEPEHPKMYSVILLNDPFTPFNLVTEILQDVFGLSEERAHSVMMSAHRSGSAQVAVLTKDVAETKVAVAENTANAQQYPLKFTVEQE